MPKKKKTKLVAELRKDDNGQPGKLVVEPVVDEPSQPPDVAEVVERTYEPDKIDAEIAKMEAVLASAGSKPDLTVEPVTVSTPALMGGIIRGRNHGKPFPCDLSAYGYGMRWPTNAVYSIPQSKYIELLHQGLDGVGA